MVHRQLIPMNASPQLCISIAHANVMQSPSKVMILINIVILSQGNLFVIDYFD
jgi:hypothetical protein